MSVLRQNMAAVIQHNKIGNLTSFEYVGEKSTECDLDKVDLLRNLDASTRETLLSSLKLHYYSQGDIVFRKGSAGRSLFFVQQGTMNVVIGDGDADPSDPSSYIVDHIVEGSVFGEIALLLSMPRTATICAETEALVYELRRDDFEAAAATSWVLNERLHLIKEERFMRFRKDLEGAVLHPTSLDAKQKAYLYEVFNQIDTDRSGNIDKDELGVMLTRLAGRFFPDEQVVAMMQLLDKDGNGTIEADEFLVGLPLLAKWLITSVVTSESSAELDLEQVQLLRGLDAVTRLNIIMALKKWDLKKGEVVFKKGSTGQSLFFLQQGVMDVIVGTGDADPSDPEGDCCVVDQISTGSVFGEMALLLSMPRTATICTASEKAVAYELERSDFEKASKDSSMLKERLDDIKEMRFARFRRDLERAVLWPDEMSPNQRANILEIFRQTDTDSSGAIDESELAVMLNRLAGHPFPERDVAAMMEVLDTSKNHVIEPDEFLAGLPLLARWLVYTNCTSKTVMAKPEKEKSVTRDAGDSPQETLNTTSDIFNLRSDTAGPVFLHYQNAKCEELESIMFQDVLS